MRGNFSLEFFENRIAVIQILSLAQPDKEKAAGSTRCRGGHAKSAAWLQPRAKTFKLSKIGQARRLAWRENSSKFRKLIQNRAIKSGFRNLRGSKCAMTCARGQWYFRPATAWRNGGGFMRTMLRWKTYDTARLSSGLKYSHIVGARGKYDNFYRQTAEKSALT